MEATARCDCEGLGVGRDGSILDQIGRPRRATRHHAPAAEATEHRCRIWDSEPTYRDTFSHGYLISSGPSRDGIPDEWGVATLGSFTCFFEPHTEYSIVRGPSCDVLLVGQAVDMDHGSTDLASIGKWVAAEHERRGLEETLRYVAYLGGRFTCHIREGRTLTVIPDAVASQSAYWYRANGECTLSTHPYLMALNREIPLNPLFDEALRKRQSVQPKYTIHAPALLTPFVGVQPIFANCSLSLTTDGAIKHQRFYPFEELPRRSFDEAYSVAEEAFLEHIRAMTGLGCIGVSLTAGLDSRSTLAAMRQVSDGKPCLAFNYINFESADSAAHDDLYAASQMSRMVESPFVIARTDRPEHPDSFTPMFRQSFPFGSQAPRIARALYEDVPHGIYEFTSTVAEIGSAFYKSRDESLWDPGKMASVYGHSPDLGQDRTFQYLFSEYAAYSEFTSDRMLGIDPYDLFYWEHRMTRWASNRYHEVDLGHRIVLPYNSRTVIEAMLSAPLENRVSKDFQKKFVDTHPL